jgi:hypothetical protein
MLSIWKVNTYVYAVKGINTADSELQTTEPYFLSERAPHKDTTVTVKQ